MKQIYIIFLIIFFIQNAAITAPQRPQNIPKEAIWDEEEQLWMQRYWDGSNKIFFWHPEGEIAIIGGEKDAKFHGKVESWYKNKNKESEGEYLNGKKEGKWKFWYENGKLKATGTYKHDIEDGEWVFWDTEGNKEKIIFFNNGIVTYRHKIGDPERPKNVNIDAAWDKKSQTWLYIDENNQCKCNIVNEWDKDGNIKRIIHFTKEFIYNGLYTSYYQNGKKEEEGNYLNGKEDGVWIYYDKDGNKIKERNYQNGKNISEKIFK